MLNGALVALRARHPDDVAVLQAGLYDDVPTRSQADSRPWRPIPEGSSASPYAVAEPEEAVAAFSVVERDSRGLVGEALLWGIDTHNRGAHIGLAVLPEFRGRGFGADTTQVLCHYGFVTLGMHRLQVETGADNVAMLRMAKRCGFVVEGLLRQAGWADGAFVDQRILGLLPDDWHATSAGRD